MRSTISALSRPPTTFDASTICSRSPSSSPSAWATATRCVSRRAISSGRTGRSATGTPRSHGPTHSLPPVRRATLTISRTTCARRARSIWLARGDGEAALGEYAVALELLGRSATRRLLLPNLGRSARAHLLLGRIDEARALAEDFLATAEASEEKPPGVTIIASFAAELDLPPTTHVIVSMAPFGLVKDGGPRGARRGLRRRGRHLRDPGLPGGGGRRTARGREETSRDRTLRGRRGPAGTGARLLPVGRRGVLRRTLRSPRQDRLQGLGVGQREAVGHARDVVDGLVGGSRRGRRGARRSAVRHRGPGGARPPPADRGTRART